MIVRYLLGFVTLLCVAMFVFAVATLNYEAALYAFVSIAVWGGFTWLARRRERFVDWLAKNRQAVELRAARYKGQPILPETVMVQYEIVVSFLAATFVNLSDHEVLGSRQANEARLACNITSLLFGWWGFPRGLFGTPAAVRRNNRDAIRVTVNELLREQAATAPM